MKSLRFLLVMMFGLLCVPGSVDGHELNSASLTLTEIAEGRFVVHWETSSPTLMQQSGTLAMFPSQCQRRENELDCGDMGLVGAIKFPWLEGSETRVLVQIDWLRSSRLLRLVDGRSPSLSVYGMPASSGLGSLKPIALDYTRLGIEHILTGFDHLLFVLALTLLVGKARRLIGTITAFTVAHSITLALTILGWLSLPAAPVETAIALSIVLVCSECVRPGDSLTRRAPWLVSFVFGLLHGFGFASSLQEIGVPEGYVLHALLFFNLGVEVGQLLAIGVFIAVAASLTRLRGRCIWMERGLVYGMGAIAAFWTLDRGVALLVP